MTKRRSQSPRGVPGVRLAVSAAAVAATLGGWVALARDTAPAALAGAEVAPAIASSIPTLVPVVTVVPEGAVQTGGMAARPAFRNRSSSRPAPLAVTRSSR